MAILLCLVFNVFVTGTNDNQLANLHEELTKKLVSSDRQLLSVLDEKLIHALALQRLQDLLSSAKSVTSFK